MDTYYTFEIKDNGDFNLHQDSFYDLGYKWSAQNTEKRSSAEFTYPIKLWIETDTMGLSYSDMMFTRRREIKCKLLQPKQLAFLLKSQRYTTYNFVSHIIKKGFYQLTKIYQLNTLRKDLLTKGILTKL